MNGLPKPGNPAPKAPSMQDNKPKTPGAPAPVGQMPKIGAATDGAKKFSILDRVKSKAGSLNSTVGKLGKPMQNKTQSAMQMPGINTKMAKNIEEMIDILKGQMSKLGKPGASEAAKAVWGAPPQPAPQSQPAPAPAQAAPAQAAPASQDNDNAKNWKVGHKESVEDRLARVKSKGFDVPPAAPAAKSRMKKKAVTPHIDAAHDAAHSQHAHNKIKNNMKKVSKPAEPPQVHPQPTPEQHAVKSPENARKFQSNKIIPKEKAPSVQSAGIAPAKPSSKIIPANSQRALDNEKTAPLEKPPVDDGWGSPSASPNEEATLEATQTKVAAPASAPVDNGQPKAAGANEKTPVRAKFNQQAQAAPAQQASAPASAPVRDKTQEKTQLVPALAAKVKEEQTQVMPRDKNGMPVKELGVKKPFAPHEAHSKLLMFLHNLVNPGMPTGAVRHSQHLGKSEDKKKYPYSVFEAEATAANNASIQADRESAKGNHRDAATIHDIARVAHKKVKVQLKQQSNDAEKTKYHADKEQYHKEKTEQHKKASIQKGVMDHLIKLGQVMGAVAKRPTSKNPMKPSSADRAISRQRKEITRPDNKNELLGRLKTGHKQAQKVFDQHKSGTGTYNQQKYGESLDAVADSSRTIQSVRGNASESHIGVTTSGKKVFANPNHSAHGAFSSKDHAEARQMHLNALNTASHGAAIDHHQNAAEAHSQMGYHQSKHESRGQAGMHPKTASAFGKSELTPPSPKPGSNLPQLRAEAGKRLAAKDHATNMLANKQKKNSQKLGAPKATFETEQTPKLPPRVAKKEERTEKESLASTSLKIQDGAKKQPAKEQAKLLTDEKNYPEHNRKRLRQLIGKQCGDMNKQK
jgi:hypothetical protein